MLRNCGRWSHVSTHSHTFLRVDQDSLAQRGLQTQPVPLAAQLLTLTPVYVDKGDSVSIAVLRNWHTSPTFVL